MLRKYLRKKIPSYIALSIIFVAAILVARFAYWESLEVEGELLEVVEIKVSDRGERVTFYSGCSEIADFWIKASQEKKTEECNKIFNTQFELKYKESEARKCNLIRAEGEGCLPPLLGTRLACIYECRGRIEELEEITD